LIELKLAAKPFLLSFAVPLPVERVTVRADKRKTACQKAELPLGIGPVGSLIGIAAGSVSVVILGPNTTMTNLRATMPAY
jgi:hypothetical protein